MIFQQNVLLFTLKLICNKQKHNSPVSKLPAGGRGGADVSVVGFGHLPGGHEHKVGALLEQVRAQHVLGPGAGAAAEARHLEHAFWAGAQLVFGHLNTERNRKLARGQKKPTFEVVRGSDDVEMSPNPAGNL